MKPRTMMKWYWLLPYCVFASFVANLISQGSFYEGLAISAGFGAVYGVVAGVTGW